MIYSPREKNIAGQKFGKLTAIKRDFSVVKPSRWFFSCECGNSKSILKATVTRGGQASCGCNNDEIDITGNRYGMLTAIERDTSKPDKHYWVFRCDCGKVSSSSKSNVMRGQHKSCGCNQREVARQQMTTHGLVSHELYETWGTMKKRCYKSYNKDYERYGARGIRVCDRWLESFENFLSDMGERPSGCTLDRIDNNGDYEPRNCRWATLKQQNNNRRGLRSVEVNGVKYNTVSSAARALGLTRRQVYYRYLDR